MPNMPIEILDCPKCGSSDLSRNRTSSCVEYICGICGKISYEEAQKIARNELRKRRDAISAEHYGYFFHVLNTFGG